MTGKQLIAIILILTFTFTTMIVGVMMVYKMRPELIGLPPNPMSAADSAKAQQVVMIDSTAIKAEIAQKAKEEQIKREMDSLRLLATKAQDSATAIARKFDSAGNKAREFQAQLTQEQESYAKKQDTLSKENLIRFAKIYDSANPQDVANILSNVDDREAAIILKLMKKKNAGKVLESMKPEKAASILTLGAVEF